MTQVPAPATPPVPQTPTPTSLGDSEAAAAAHARLAEAFPEGTQPGTPAGTPPPAAPAAPGEPAPAETDLFDDAAIDGLNFDGLQYRDGMKLRDQIVKARDTYRPFRDAFATMDEGQRQALLDSAPMLGADLATVAQVNARLHPEDRAYFQEAMSKFAAGDVEGGTQMLEEGAASIRAAMGTQAAAPAPPAAGTSPLPDWAQPPPGTEPPAGEFLTKADLDAALAADRQQRDFADTVAREQASIVAQARELGYDPDAPDDSPEQDRYQFLLNVAGRPGMGFDLAKAHDRVAGLEQGAIDRFVQAKSADATRPAAPAVAGVAPADTRTLETMTDGQQAMRSRLDGTLGPDPRRRAPE